MAVAGVKRGTRKRIGKRRAAVAVAVALGALVLLSFGALGARPAPQQVSTGTSNDNRFPSMALDSNGNPNVVWSGNDGETTQIYYAENTGAGWTPQLVSTGATTQNGAPQIALDSNGNPNVVWSGNDGETTQIYYAENTGGGWNPKLVSTATSLVNALPQMALDSAGNPNVVWHGNDGSVLQVYFAENTGAGWTPQQVSSGISHSGQNPQIMLDSAGNPNVVWHGNDGATNQVYYAENTGGGWTPQLVSTGASDSNQVPRIALDSTGNPNVAWCGSDESVFQAYYAENTGGGWTPQLVSTGTSTGNEYLQMALDSAGNPNVVWHGFDGSVYQIYYAENTGGGWIPQQVSTGASYLNLYPKVELDSAGNPNVVWHGNDVDTTQIYYAENTGGGWTPEVVSTGATFSNMHPETALDPAGNPNVVWHGWDGASYEVWFSASVTPTLTTTAASDITLTGASSGGNVTDDGGETVTARGVCWSTSRNPTTANSHTNNGTGTGTFTSSITGCSPGTRYYVRAYATNSVGTSYGSERAFTTKAVSSLSTWYLAEGTTAWGFSTYISIQNPNAAPEEVTVTYMPKGAANVQETLTLPASSQTTLTNDHLVQKMGGVYDFSTRVEANDESKAIAVDRTMEWGGEGAGRSGRGSYPEGHSSVGVTAPATAWYLPEGSTRWGFETWLLIQNPGGKEASCDITYMIEGKGPRTVTHRVPAHSRESYSMRDDAGYEDASIKVASDVPVIPERAMYRYNRREGHDSIGTTTPATDYYLAEGAVGYPSEYTTYILVQNPHSSLNDVTITYLTGSGAVPGPSFTMEANSRRTIRVNDQLPPNTDVSTRVHGSQTLIAERAMYWKARYQEACHDSIGMSAPARTFYLPDGQSSEARETWTLVQNPNGTDVSVTITYLTPTGTGNVTMTETIPGNSRKTFNMEEHSGLNARASIMVRSATLPIMCERAMYWSDRSAGTDTIGGSEQASSP